jgi:hypothetical protein
LVKSGHERVELAQRLLGNERLPSEGEKRTARWISHPSGQALPLFRGFDKQLAFSSLGITLNRSYLLTVQRMERILDFDGAQIAGIIRRRLQPVFGPAFMPGKPEP